MDPGLPLGALPLPPIADAGGLVAVGAWFPVALPTRILTPAQRAAAAVDPGLPLGRRLEWFLAVGDEAAAIAACQAAPGPWSPEVAGRIALWSAQVSAALELPAGVSISVQGGSLPEAAGALEEVRTLLALPQRWMGPVVVVLGNDPVVGLPPGETILPRPACPLLRLPVVPQGQGRALLAGRLTGLVLALHAPPAAGWPRWLTTGLAQVVAATAAGRGPGPKSMLDRRAAAGLAALERTLEADTPDPALSEALATALLVPWRRARLGDLLDRLRDGASSAAAIAGATGTTVQELCVQR